jgi:hypothetical protein
MPEKALEGWHGRYVSMWALDGDGRAKQYGGRIETVGSDGFVFQPASSPEHTRELPPPAFFPWHSIRLVQLIGEQAPGDEETVGSDSIDSPGPSRESPGGWGDSAL